MKRICIWLDDERPLPQDLDPGEWVWAKTVDEAKEALVGGDVALASLDNDLGIPDAEGRHLVLWMCEEGIWPTEGIDIHSANVVGVTSMSALIERYGPYGRPSPDRRRFRRP
jgi:hypothetical protein